MGLTKRLMEDDMEDPSEFDPPKHLIADEDEDDDEPSGLSEPKEDETEAAIREMTEEFERKMRALKGASPHIVPKSRPGTVVSAPVKPTMDIVTALKGLAEVQKASMEVDSFLSKEGVKSSEFLDRNSEKVTPLYRFFNDESCAGIVVTASVFKGVKTSMKINAKKMSGAAMKVPAELHPVLASAAFGAAIPEMGEVAVTYDVNARFVIAEDAKLKMYYQVMSYPAEKKLDSYITILDPDMMI